MFCYVDEIQMPTPFQAFRLSLIWIVEIDGYSSFQESTQIASQSG